MKHTVKEVILNNGARGLLIDVPNATVASFQFQFRAGDRYVKDKNKYETAHLMEHLSFGANEKFDNEHAYEAEFTKNGAFHNAYTSDLSMCYVADCADFEWKRILELQRLAICSSKFKEHEMLAEKGNVKSELTGYLNNHSRILWPRVQQVLGEKILSYTERLKTIDRITIDDIKEHYTRTHTSDNMRFLIAGNIGDDEQYIIDHLESWNLPRGERFVVPQDKLASNPPEVIVRKEASNLSFGLSLVLPYQLDDVDSDAMGCLNHILTGTMHSRIYGSARKNGLAYGVFSELNISDYDSAWDFGGQVNHESAEKLFDIFLNELQNVKLGKISEEELEAAKSYALGRRQMSCQTVASVANYYSGRYCMDETIRNYDKAPEEIKNVTREKMLEVARKFFTKDAVWALVGVGHEKYENLQSIHKKLSVLFEEK